MKLEFNPAEWLPQTVRTEHDLSLLSNETILRSSTEVEKDIESIISQIEQHSIDITGDYFTWRNLGFAFSDSLGEAGRDPFHRISKFHPEYNSKECDHQFDACLKANGSGITISTFFHHAKDHGIVLESKFKSPMQLSVATDNLNHETDQMPNLPDHVFPNLPSFLQHVVEVATSIRYEF